MYDKVNDQLYLSTSVSVHHMDLLEYALPDDVIADWGSTYETNAGDEYIFLEGIGPEVEWDQPKATYEEFNRIQELLQRDEYTEIYEPRWKQRLKTAKIVVFAQGMDSGTQLQMVDSDRSTHGMGLP
jgi:hypothetical protein